MEMPTKFWAQMFHGMYLLSGWTDLQDTLLGCKLVTQRDTFITKDVMMNILMNIQVRGTSPASSLNDCAPPSIGLLV